MTGYTMQVQNELIARLNNQALAVLDFSSYEVPPGYDVPPIVLTDQTGGNIHSVAVLPNGQVVSTSSCALRVWDINSGNCVKVLNEHTGTVHKVIVLPNSQVVSTSQDTTLRVWDVNSGTCVKMLNGHASRVWSVTLLSNGQIVSAGVDDKTLRVWDINSGTCVKVLNVPGYQILSVAALSNDQVVVAGGGALRIWDINSGTCVKVLNGHTQDTYSVAVLPNGQVVSASWDKTLRVWDINSGTCVKVLNGHTSSVYSVAVLPNGQVVSTSFDNTLRIWDIISGNCVKVLNGHIDYVYSVAALPNGQIVSGCRDKTLRVWTPFPRLSYEMIAPVLTVITPASTLNSLYCQNIELGQAGYAHVLHLAQTVPSLKVINVTDTDLTVNQANEIKRALQEKQRQVQLVREQTERIRQIETQQQEMARNIQGVQTYQQAAQARQAQKKAAREQAELARQLEIQERARNQQIQEQAAQALRQLTEDAALNYRENRYEAALLQCEEGLARDANNLILLKLKALTYYQQGLYAKAQTGFNQRDAIEHEGSNIAWAALSRWKKDKTELALNLSLQEINTVISLAPQKAIGYLVRGHLFLASNKLAKAEMDFILFSEKLLIPACGIDDYERAALISLHEKGLAKLALKKEAAKPIEPTARVIPFNIAIHKPAINISPVEVPQDYLCPITHEIMLSPVMAEDGYTYEEEAIKAHFQVKLTSPMSNEPIENARLLPSRTLRSLILKFLDTHPEFREDGQSESVYFSRQREQDVCDAIQTGEIGAVLSYIEQDKRLLTRPLTKGLLIEQALASQDVRLLSAVLDKLTPSMWATLLDFHALSYWLVKIAALPVNTLQDHIELITVFLNAAQASPEFNYVPQELIELGLQQSCAVLLIMGLTQLGGINTPLDEEKNTALHRAALSGDISLISALIEQGACLSLKNTAGRKPKDLALLHNHIEVAERLKEAKIQPLLEKMGIFKTIRQQSETIQQLNEKIQQQEQAIKALREPVSLPASLINITPGL